MKVKNIFQKSFYLRLVLNFCLLACVASCTTLNHANIKDSNPNVALSTSDTFGPAYVGETQRTPCPNGTLVSTKIVLDRDNAELHLVLPHNADPTTFTITAPGRRIVSIETHWQEFEEGGNADTASLIPCIAPIIVVYFDANAIPNTEKARAHMYPNAKPDDPMPVLNMVNLAATYSYVVPHNAVVPHNTVVSDDADDASGTPDDALQQ